MQPAALLLGGVILVGKWRHHGPDLDSNILFYPKTPPDLQPAFAVLVRLRMSIDLLYRVYVAVAQRIWYRRID